MTIAKRLLADLQRDFGIQRHQAAGIVGNLAHESGGFKSLQEIKPLVPGSRGGYGYAQWTGPRRRAFERFSAENGFKPSSYQANYSFLKHELTNTPESSVMKRLSKARNATEAATIFSNKFLRPGIPHMTSRHKWANNLMQQKGTEMQNGLGRLEKALMQQRKPVSGAKNIMSYMPKRQSMAQQVLQNMNPQPKPADESGHAFIQQKAPSGSSKLAEALMGQAMSNEPIETGLEAIGRLAQMYAGSRMQKAHADHDVDQANRKRLSDAMMAHQNQERQWARQDAMRADDRAHEQQQWQQRNQAQNDEWTRRQEYARQNAPETPGYKVLASDIAKQMGLPEGTYQQGPKGKISKIGGGGTNVTVNAPFEKAESKERAKGLVDRYNTIAEDGYKALDDLNAINRLGELAGSIDTGGYEATLKEAFSRVTGKEIAGVDNIQAFQSLVDYMTPRMRVAGSGASSDKDMATFRNALPGLMKTPEGNKLIIETLGGMAQYRADMGEIAMQYQEGGISAVEARKLMKEMSSPFKTFSEKMKLRQTPKPSGKVYDDGFGELEIIED